MVEAEALLRACRLRRKTAVRGATRASHRVYVRETFPTHPVYRPLNALASMIKLGFSLRSGRLVESHSDLARQAEKLAGPTQYQQVAFPSWPYTPLVDLSFRLAGSGM